MTLQDLKANRNEIINFITVMGYDLKFAMEMAVEICGNCEDVEELKSELRNFCHRGKSTRNAEILARLSEMDED